jgi:2-polyprenyl-3-methyl-5-hydroxy-6-metoxy-1,4-benzoquinol methylase
MKVLEVGAGTGAFTLRLKEGGYHVVASGIEPETFALEDVPYVCLDLNKELPTEHCGSCEAVVAIEVIEHVENIFDFFRKLARLLAPGGFAFITTPNIVSTLDRLIFLKQGMFNLFRPRLIDQPGHIQIIPYWLVIAAAEKAGLYLKHIQGVGFYMNDAFSIWQRMAIFMTNKIITALGRENFPRETNSHTVLFIFNRRTGPRW